MRKKMICICLSLLMISLFVTIRCSRYFNDACETYVEQGIKGEISQNINQIIFSNTNRIDGQFIKVTNLPDGHIGDIYVDTIQINNFASNVALEMYDKIKTNEYKFGIPFGNIMGYKMLAGKGPKLSIKVTPVGAFEYEVMSEVKSCGINQSLHTVWIEFQCEIECLAPFYSSKIIISPQIIISEILIVGNVPNVLFPLK